MAYRIVEDILLVVHADVAPSAEDWAGMVWMRDACASRVSLLSLRCTLRSMHASARTCN